MNLTIEEKAKLFDYLAQKLVKAEVQLVHGSIQYIDIPYRKRTPSKLAMELYTLQNLEQNDLGLF